MSYSSTILADSPVRYFRLGEPSGTTATDSSASATNGTYVGSPTLAQTGLLTGDSDTAVLFNTIAVDGVRLSATNHIIGGQANFTIEGWIKTADTTKAIFLYCERAGGASNNDIVRFETNVAKTIATFTYRDTAGTLNTVNSATVTAFANSNAHHLVVTKSGTSVKIYIDGAQSGSTGTLTATDTLSSTVVSNIGIDASDATAGLKSVTVDEVALYTTALSAAQVLAHYNAGIAAAAASSGVVRTGAESFITIITADY